MLILKIVGFTLLGVLGLALLILLTVLFVPIRYSGRIRKNGSEISLTGRADWLLGFVSLKAKYEDKEFTKQGRVAFVKLWKPKKEEEDSFSFSGDVGYENFPAPPSDFIKIPDEDAAKETKKETIKETKKESKKESKKETEKEKKKEDGTPSVLKRIGNLYKNREILRRLWEKKKDVILKAFGRIKKLLLHIIPKKMKGYAEFGFDDPATTGEVLGAISAVYAFTGPLVSLKPDFEKKIFDCDIEIRGRIRIFTVALIAVLLYFNKELRTTIKRVIRLSEVVKEDRS